MKKGQQATRAASTDDLVVVARLARTRGIRGELVADLLTDFPERFDKLDSVIAILPDGRRERLRIEGHWFHGDRIVLKFSGYDSIESSSKLIGSELAVPEADRFQLPPDSFYDWELAGCWVETIAGKLVGKVSELMRTGGVEMLVVEDGKGRQWLIPLAHDICTKIDVKRKLIRIDPPEGLLDL